MADVSDSNHPADYAVEAQEKWGKTAAWQESSRRTKTYSAQDWAQIKQAQDDNYRSIATAMAAGVAPDSDLGRALAAVHRGLIDRYFYPCSASMHAQLGDMYLADDRFSANMDAYGAGLTQWLVAAIRANVA